MTTPISAYLKCRQTNGGKADQSPGCGQLHIFSLANLTKSKIKRMNNEASAQIIPKYILM